LYGLPDLTDSTHSASETADAVLSALQYTIETYEPRLRGVRVEHTPGDEWNQVLRFRIQAQLIVDRSRTPVSFETRIDPSRRIHVA
jgi:type VI secretion system lysozyme-like protein